MNNRLSRKDRKQDEAKALNDSYQERYDRQQGTARLPENRYFEEDKEYGDIIRAARIRREHPATIAKRKSDYLAVPKPNRRSESVSSNERLEKLSENIRSNSGKRPKSPSPLFASRGERVVDDPPELAEEKWNYMFSAKPRKPFDDSTAEPKDYLENPSDDKYQYRPEEKMRARSSKKIKYEDDPGESSTGRRRK
jgi:hypothetical protein